MINIVSLVLAVALFCAIDYILAQEFYRAAVMKGHAEKKYYWYCILLTLGGYILICALPDRGRIGDNSAIVCEDLPEI